MRYFITFTCYGSHLHGAESGSVDQHHNLPGSRLMEPNARLEAREQRNMIQPGYSLGQETRAAVLEALREVCRHRKWTLLAAHVRISHVHIVVEAPVAPERVMNDFKTYSSRRLKALECGEVAGRKRWTRHGSTRWLWTDKDVSAATDYVVYGQGEPMAVFGGE